jgi:hypothetical protein
MTQDRAPVSPTVPPRASTPCSELLHAICLPQWASESSVRAYFDAPCLHLPREGTYNPPGALALIPRAIAARVLLRCLEMAPLAGALRAENLMVRWGVAASVCILERAAEVGREDAVTVRRRLLAAGLLAEAVQALASQAVEHRCVGNNGHSEFPWGEMDGQ